MITYTEGDILLSKSHVIAHGIAPHDHFSQGLALALRNEWPAMYKDFRSYCRGENPTPGSLWTWSGVGGKRIVSLFTQEASESEGGHPGKASLSHVRACLKNLRKFIESEKPSRVALPRLATGVGGLHWDEVKASIEETLGDLETPIFVYQTFRHDVKSQDDGCKKCETCECD